MALRELGSLSREVYLSDRRNPAASESFLRQSLEAVFDAGRHILAKGYGEKDVEYKTVARLLIDKGVVSSDCGQQLIKMAGYRNRMVHLYHRVTPEELYEIIQNHLADLDLFVAEIQKFLERYRRSQTDQGFTLAELVIVLIVLGIIAAVAIPRLADTTGTKSSALARKIRSDIAYAQELAMTRNLRARVYLNGTGTAPAQGYAVALDSAPGNCSAFAAVQDPAGAGGLSVTLNAGDYAGITVTPTTTCLEYDSLGRPFDCSANLGVCSSTSSGVSITVNPTGSVTVTAQTGRVSVP